MIINKKLWLNGFLIALVLMIHGFSRNSNRVELWYSEGVYPWIGQILRLLFGWIPLSLGDVLYGLVVVWVVYRLWNIKRTFTKWRALKVPLWKLITGKVWRALAILYIVFNLMWGLNYNRAGLNDQLALSKEPYSKEELMQLNTLLLQKVNAFKNALDTPYVYPKKSELFERAANVYAEAAQVYPYLEYRRNSLKPSMWGWLGNYSGFTGYYNPLTGEAQTNMEVPAFLRPFITCHEIAHQIGYAKEDEANFAAYLAISNSSDTLFRYSGYLDVFLYANRNLFYVDSSAAKSFRAQLNTSVKKDMEEWKKFSSQYKNPVAPVITWLYGKYLERNAQPSGMRSYDQVTAYLINYYKKKGWL